MKSVSENLTKLTEEDTFLTLTEIEAALQQMKNGKSPGIDGLSIQFFLRLFAQILKMYYLMRTSTA